MCFFSIPHTRLYTFETEASQPITYRLLINSTTWGNHSSANFEYIRGKSEDPEDLVNKSGRIKIPTGSTEYTKANNIYDMAGNVWEWTLESNYIYSRILRGGYGDYGSAIGYSVSSRDSNFPGSLKDSNGCRAVLIIK